MRKTALVVAALVCLLVAGCGDKPADQATDKDRDKVTQASEEPSEDPTPEVLVSDEEIPLDLSMTDDVTGETVKVLSYIPSVEVPADFVEKYVAYDGVRVLLAKVEISVPADAKYRSVLSGDSLKLFGTPRADFSAQTAVLLLDQVYADKYPRPEDVSVGESATGWTGWLIKDTVGSEPFEIVLARQASKVLGSDEEIPAAEFSVTLPTS
ncbi:MAG: hypothetical protein LBJ02_09640 [Bifidobacteriaceae bacterium]|jgi:hypothetical protein|nr:hypothetical protein [Bifidobacteriaceae bacterium]